MTTPDRTNGPNESVEAPADVDLDRVWHGIASEVWSTQPGFAERAVRSVLRPPGLARALVVTPSLVLSWVLASVAILAIGVVFTHSTDTPWVALMAPALAGASIAYAYGPGVDPAFELTQSMPISHRMILLARVVSVFSVNALLGLIASLAAPEMLDLTIGWLVPMTTVSAIGLASATLARSANVGVAIALTSWGLIIFAGASRTPGTPDLAVAVTEQRLIPLYLIVTIAMSLLTLYASSTRRERSSPWQSL